MAKYQAYAEYKDSGVEWLGEVPNDWDILSIARVSNKITNGYVGATRDIFFDSGIRYLQSLHIKNNNINFHTPYYVSESWSNEKSKSILKEGDVLIVQTGDIGQVAAVTKEFEGCNCHALIIVSGTEKISGFYLAWLLNSNYGRQTLKSIQTGALHPHLNCDAIKDIKIPLPDIDIQNKITSFLDHETTKIDHLIEKQQQLIELLKEKRQAVISHAVTKGLNPNVPMKDSGVEWLAEVPEHWKIIKGGYIGTLFGSESIQEDDVTDQGSLPFIKVSSLSAETFKLSNIDWFVSERRAKFCKAEKNYIVFPKRGAAIFTNKVNVIEVDSVIDPNLMGWKIGKQGITEYFALLLKTRGLDDIADVSTVPQINNKHIAPEKFPLPTLSEQCEIVKFVGMELTKFDEMILKAESAIQLMQERRTALISAVVTGKIDVRNWQAPTVAEADTELSA
ncbi:restriction endonuclease subunit S [Acinetobacter johnsonii]|uniref:restriction endonuclease subunit S n=1 Tax=Acinetobacter johnsonii TaxID=40214 RepID=UPI003AF5F193